DAHGYAMQDLEQRRYTRNFREMMRDLVNRTHLLLLEGLPLIEKVDRRLAVDLELFSRGGLAILEKIRAQEYNVLERRPAPGEKGRAGVAGGVRLGGGPGPACPGGGSRRCLALPWKRRRLTAAASPAAPLETSTTASSLCPASSTMRCAQYMPAPAIQTI